MFKVKRPSVRSAYLRSRRSIRRSLLTFAPAAWPDAVWASLVPTSLGWIMAGQGCRDGRTHKDPTSGNDRRKAASVVRLHVAMELGMMEWWLAWLPSSPVTVTSSSLCCRVPSEDRHLASATGFLEGGFLQVTSDSGHRTQEYFVHGGGVELRFAHTSDD